MDSSSESESRPRKTQNNKKSKDEWGEADILANQILRVVSQNSQNHEKMIQARQTKLLLLKILQKKPHYLCDSTHCIQAILKPPTQHNLNPLNKFDSQYYHAHPKPHILFNCHDQILQQEKPLYPSAYHPAYHYQNYEQFQERRRNTKILVSCQKMQITSWSIMIGNVSRSGYYGPVLVIHQWRRGKGENFVLEHRVQNILFNKQISVYLDSFRLKDMKKLDFPKQKAKFSLMYYMRDRQSDKRPPKMSNFSNLDTKNQILQTNQNVQINFIPFGQMSQYQIFKRPVQPKYLCKKKQIINLSKYIEEELKPSQIQRQSSENQQDNESSGSSFVENQQIYRKNYRQREEEYEEGQIYAMEDQADKQNRKSDNRMASQESDEDDGIDSQDQDYLKKAYLKAMRNQSFL